MRTRIVPNRIEPEWAMCECYIWPIAPGFGGRCGQCGVAPYIPIAAPPDGKARPLDESWRIQ